MFDNRDFYKLLNARTDSRYNKEYEQLQWMAEDLKIHKGPKENRMKFFRDEAQFLLTLMEMEKKWDPGYFQTATLAELAKDQEVLISDVARTRYAKSILNPRFAAKTLGYDVGPLLAAVASRLRDNILYAYRHMRFAMHWNNELFLEVYQLFSQEKRVEEGDLRRLLEERSLLHLKEEQGLFLHDRYGFEDSYRADLIREFDWTDTGNLYALGEFVTENEITLSRFMASLPEETVEKIASAFVQGFRKGFFRDGKDILGRRTVAVHYPLGMERMIRKALILFEEELHYVPYIHTISTAASNTQYEYDHRFDAAAFLTEEYCEKYLASLEEAAQENRDMLAAYGGAAWVLPFGEKPYEPQARKESLTLSPPQQALYTNLISRRGEILNRYVPPEYTSYTMIAFPVPEIGEHFEEIFMDMIEVNTLDEAIYNQAQQTLIEALDRGVKVRVLGDHENETNLEVALHPLANPARQTNFFNCGADVNIPLGEVFTSPQLKGTNGVLHVKEAFLDGLRYENLKLTFTDGEVTDYSCTNFESEEEGRRYIQENLLFPHDSLPMGEFAIGTNTTAYRMAQKYGIVNRLPVLVVEKMGPHFALGDTCFSHEEDRKVFNPQDRREVIARDNERSILRRTKPEEAYTQKHIDITLPYDQLGLISAVAPDGRETDILRGGRFVLRGTDVLNEALKEE